MEELICYCFNFSREDIRREMKETGKTTILDFISSQIKAGHCACAVKNPKKRCCLGDILAAVKQIKKEDQP